MAEVKGPLMSMSASGRLGKDVVYFERDGKQLVRKYVKHSISDSSKSVNNRNIFKEAIKLSKQLTDLDREAWNLMTEGLPINGHNLFMKLAMDTMHSGNDFLPVSIHNYSFMANKACDNYLRLDVAFNGKPDGDFFLFIGEGSFKDWVAGDVINGEGGVSDLLLFSLANTGKTGSGGFTVNGFLPGQEYWFRLVEVEYQGISAVFNFGG